MAPSTPDASTGLRDLESRFIRAVFANMTERPTTDWAGVAAVMGLKDAKCARERFRQMSLRHGWIMGGGGSGGGGVGATGGAGPSPVKGGKVARKPRTPRKKAKKESSDEEEIVKTEGGDADCDAEI